MSYVGLPHGVSIDVKQLFLNNISVAGGMSPAHHYMASLVPQVLDRTIEPGLVYTKQYELDDIALAYDDMDQRRTIKPIVRMG